MKRRLALAWLTGSLAAAASIGLLATSAWLITRAAQRPPVLYLMVAVTAVQAFGIGRAAPRYAERLTGHDAALRLLADLRTHAYARLVRLAPAGIAEFRSGDLISRLVADIDSLADRWLRVLLPYATALTAGAGAITLSAVILPPAGAALAATLVVTAFAAPALVAVFAGRAERALLPLRAELAAATTDLLNGAAELAVFAPGRELDAVTVADAALARCERRSAYGRGVGAAVAVAAAGAAVWLALLFGGRTSSTSPHPLSPLLLAVVVLMPLAAHEVFGGLAPAAQEIPRLRAAGARVSGVLTRPEPVREPTTAAPVPPRPYDIRIEHMSAPYALRDISLTVPAGSSVVVTGPSGSGKTTLAMVLLRFLDPVAGRVLLGGTDITAMRGDDVRRVVGVCAQDAHIFDTTIRENLRLARPLASDAELLDALRRVRLDLGLDTPAGEHGTRLSGGQRQRLALARVLLADFPVVIFDEPAEHLDEATATALMDDLMAQTHGRTRIVITHRPVTADQELRIAQDRAQRPAESPGHAGRTTLSPDEPRRTV
jgi:thiol reductant ABC exporter CydC subunit